jgi:LysR family transcriptional activator of glutamate synthase operon
MDNKSLIYFKKVAEVEHITNAARALFVSPAQLSRTISDLEHEMGAPLFDRVGRNIKLNDNGKVFYNYALKILADYEEATSAIKDTATQRAFETSFGTNCPTYTPALLLQLSDKMTELHIREVSAPRSALVTQLFEGRLNFAIASPPINEAGVEFRLLLKERAAVIYPPDHWLAHTSVTSLYRIKDEAFIGAPVGYGARDAMEHYYREEGIAPQFSLETANTFAIPQYVQNNLGIAVIPKSVAVQNDYSKGHYSDLDEQIIAPIGISWLKERQLSSTQRFFLNECLRYFSVLNELLNLHPVQASDDSAETPAST